MNKELYIKTENKNKELRNLQIIIRELENFLSISENKFTQEKSIEAIKKIKDYYETKQKELAEQEEIHKHLYKELYTTCKHEIAIKYSNRPAYYCLICDNCLDKDRNIIENIANISIDTTEDYKVAYIIEEAFNKVVHSDKDLIETINNLLEELQYDRNIKIKRRIK